MANDLKIVFPDGNVINKANAQCFCPNALNVDLTDLILGKKYTVFINNLNTTPVRLFPESFSFVADDTNKRITFHYQFG
jgi:hypothetical protein